MDEVQQLGALLGAGFQRPAEQDDLRTRRRTVHIHPGGDQPCERDCAVRGHLVGPLDGLRVAGQQPRYLVDGDVEAGDLVVPLRVDLGEGLERHRVEFVGPAVVGGDTLREQRRAQSASATVSVTAHPPPTAARLRQAGGATWSRLRVDTHGESVGGRASPCLLWPPVCSPAARAVSVSSTWLRATRANLVT
ncbi:hypothetical protein KTR9_3340 [Gordonia sp. KTR9]|nr:hypothetical protein KTR9_3340 [Gordonia sp. KTR9]